MFVCPNCGWETKSAAEMDGHMSRHRKHSLPKRFGVILMVIFALALQACTVNFIQTKHVGTMTGIKVTRVVFGPPLPVYTVDVTRLNFQYPHR